MLRWRPLSPGARTGLASGPRCSLDATDTAPAHVPLGWLEGVRLADGEKGWVPQAYVEEISSLSARLRNLRENKRVTRATSKLGGPPV